MKTEVQVGRVFLDRCLELVSRKPGHDDRRDGEAMDQ